MTHNVNDFSKVFALSHMVTGFPFALFTDFFLPIFAILLFIFFAPFTFTYFAFGVCMYDSWVEMAQICSHSA